MQPIEQTGRTKRQLSLPTFESLRADVEARYFRWTVGATVALSFSLTALSTAAVYVEEMESMGRASTLPFFTTYVVVFVLFLPHALYESGVKEYLRNFRHSWLMYAALAFLEYEGGFLRMSSSPHITFMSNSLTDAWTLFLLSLLGWVYLCVRYRWVHYGGLLFALVGTLLLFVHHYFYGIVAHATYNGDRFVILGSTLTAFALVFAEHLLRRRTLSAVLAGAGFWGMLMSGGQFALLEGRAGLMSIAWSWRAVAVILSVSVLLASISALGCAYIQRTGCVPLFLAVLFSATHLKIINIVLGDEVYSHWIPASLILVLLGIVSYSLRAPGSLITDQDPTRPSSRAILPVYITYAK